MAIDIETGEHICFGLMIGQCCASCRSKYPHLLASANSFTGKGKAGRAQPRSRKLRINRPLPLSDDQDASGENRLH
jgi:hypothetical protein